MAEYKGIEYLRAKLNKKRARVQRRYAYYEMKHLVKDLGISTPPQLKAWNSSLGWCSRAVDELADRLVFKEFQNDNFGLNEIYSNNNADVLFDSAIIGALITSCDFIYISEDDIGYPRMQVIDGGNATGIIDPITNMLTEGYAVLQRDDKTGAPVVEAYFIPGCTYIYTKGERTPQAYPNAAPFALLVPIINRPDARRPFGHSVISRSCMDLQTMAIRTLKRSEISAEFYSFPQKYINGLAEDAELDKWSTAMSALLQITRDEDGEKPVIGQFQQASMTPHLDMLKMCASAFAGQTGLTLDDLGFPTANPSSYEAIKAAHESLARTGRKCQRTFGTGFLNAGYLAACVRDNRTYPREIFAETKPKFEPMFAADAQTLSGIGDAIIKIQQAAPGYLTEEKINDLLGL